MMWVYWLEVAVSVAVWAMAGLGVRLAAQMLKGRKS